MVNRFVENNSSLNLNRVYIIATQSSASASELVINCLDPYIDVIHIGTNTYGKYQASVTLYDAEDFSLEDANPNHTYACLLYTSPSPRDVEESRMPSSA